MKRVLSLLLVCAMLFSLAACSTSSKDGDKDGRDDQKQSQAPEGDNKNIPASNDTWDIGPVDMETVMTQDRIPSGVEGEMKVVLEFLTETGGMTIGVATKDGKGMMEIESRGTAATMKSKVFEVDGVTYMYVEASADGESDSMVYKLGEDTMDMDDLVSGFTGTGVDSMDPEDVLDTSFESMEYIGLIDGEDVFEAVLEGYPCRIMIDHATGYLSGMTIPPEVLGDETTEEDIVFTGATVRFYYSVSDDEMTMNVTDAIEDDEMSAAFFLIAQFALLADIDFSDLGGDDYDDGFHWDYELDDEDNIDWSDLAS